MTPEETDLKKCDFGDINEYYKQTSEERKAMSKKKKLKIKEMIRGVGQGVRHRDNRRA